MQLHDYQEYCVNQIIEKPNVALFLDMGLGKTVISLTAIKQLIGIEVDKVLVIAPLRVAQSGWAQECAKWDHLRDLRVSRILGSPKEREAAIQRSSDVYVINRENVAWLVEQHERDWQWDMVVIDELSSFKSAQSRRFKALRSVRHKIQRMVGLTGTPAPNTLIDLWSQIYLIDQGQRLGRFIGRYRDAFFRPRILPSTGVVYKYDLIPGMDEAIYDRIKDICISMKAADHIKMPERIDNVITVEMDAATKAQYETMKKDLVLKLSEEEVISAASAVAVSGKLLQMANGSIYDEDHGWHALHSLKLDALQDIVEGANGKPVLVYYGFKFDLQRIQERLGDDAVVLKDEKTIEDWNKGKIRVLLAHPDSAGHGLNLQAGGHIQVWYGLTWSLEKYQQACARLYRQGQKETVIIHHIVTKDTLDEEVMSALSRKAAGQDALIQALKAEISRL